MRRTEAWWVCSCGEKISRPGKNLLVAFDEHRKITGCACLGGIQQVEQRKEGK